MYRKILAPLDGSELADIALTCAIEMAAALPGAKINLLHVYNKMEDGLDSMHRDYIEKAAAKAAKRAGKDAEKEVKGELVSGNPTDEIIKYANKQKVDLIIMATHGRSGISRWAMGSVAYNVMRSVSIPVCLVRAGISEEIVRQKSNGKVCIVPLDGTKRAESVLPYVKALVKQYDGALEVVLLRVCPKPDISADYPHNMPLSWEEHVKREKVKCKLVAGVYLAEIAKQLKSEGIDARMELSMGNPAKAIIKYDNASDSRLIAMSVHGRSGISRWAFGSVAETVMMGTFTPILMLKTD